MNSFLLLLMLLMAFQCAAEVWNSNELSLYRTATLKDQKAIEWIVLR